MALTKVTSSVRALAAGEVEQSHINSAVTFGATGGGTDEVFYQNSTNVTTDFTVSKSSVSAGEIIIDSGKTVTISSGNQWVIV